LRAPSLLELIIICAIIFATGYFIGNYTGSDTVITIDTTDVQIEYIPVPDTTLIKAAIDSVNKVHRVAQQAYIRNIEQIALDRDGLLTETDTLRAIVFAQRAAIRELTKLKVVRTELEGCGILTFVYNPVSGETTINRIGAPPKEITTITITKTEVKTQTNYKTLLYAIGAGAVIGYLIAPK